MERIEINSTEWTIEAMRAGWAEDESLTAAQVSDCADSQYAWLINSTGVTLRGWSYTGKGFTGPSRKDAITQIYSLISAAVDYVLENLDEIKSESACVFHRDEPAACSGTIAWKVAGDGWCAEAMKAYAADMGASDPAVRQAVKVA